MTSQGHDSTLEITLDDMLYHTRAVRKGVSAAQDECHEQYLKHLLSSSPVSVSAPPASPMIITDMPFGSYGVRDAESLWNAIRVMKESGADGVKLEGGTPERVALVRQLVEAGVPVLGHIGLIPQSFKVLGGYRSQGRTAHDALTLVRQAQELQDAGVFALVIECVPAAVGRAISRAISVPTIGIGAGRECDGQVLVYNDLLGMANEHPYFRYDQADQESANESDRPLETSPSTKYASSLSSMDSTPISITPSFCRKYTCLGNEIQRALRLYGKEVREGSFPSPAHFSSYKMRPEEEALFEQQVEELLARQQVCDEKEELVEAVEKLY